MVIAPSSISVDLPDPRLHALATSGQISIVIPAHNEEGAIGDVIRKLQASLPSNVAEIIVVDDGSRDRTAELVAETSARLVRHPTNRGYGAALKTGIRTAVGEYIMTVDADGQHRIEDVQQLCQAIQIDQAPDMVIGHRTALLHSSLWRMPGKWVLTQLARVLTQREIRDLNSGLRVMRRDVLLRYMHLCPSGFSFSTTITFALASRGYKVDFVPIKVEKRIGTSTVSVRTGFQTILLILRLASLFNPLRIFLPLSFVSFFAGVAWAIPYLLRHQGLTVASMLLLVTSVLLFALGLICDQVAQLRLERYE
jgi:glycosyltransferase involved in cell wall biosynthesis